MITKKYLDAGHPIDFIKSVISDLKIKDENQPMIPAMIMMLKGLLIKLKALLEAK